MFKKSFRVAMIVLFGTFAAASTTIAPAAAAFDAYMPFQSDHQIAWSGADGDE